MGIATLAEGLHYDTMRLEHVKLPDEELARALREVAQRAEYLLQVTEGQNLDLPDDFPKDQFLNIARALTKLPDGSQEGCYEHLEHAEEYLPEIRDLHFPSEELVVSGSKAALQRGGAIDRALESLMASVPTALARYRRIARIKPPKKKPEAAIEAAIALPERMRAEPIANATRLERELSAARVEVEAMTEPHSKPAEDLKRQITDGIELSRLARILLSMKELVVSRYGRVVDALKDYPDLLQRSFSAIRVGIDVAENLADSWVKFEHNMIHLLFDAFRQAVAILEEAAVEASLLSNGARTFNINEARRLRRRTHG